LSSGVGMPEKNISQNELLPTLVDKSPRKVKIVVNSCLLKKKDDVFRNVMDRAEEVFIGGQKQYHGKQ
jgi:hypothetical protein